MKNCCNGLHLKANAQSLLYSVREKWRESDCCTAMTSDYETWQRGKVISNVLNSVSLESLNTLRATREPPHPLPLRELCPTVMPSSPPSRHRPNRSRKGEQSEKSSALSWKVINDGSASMFSSILKTCWCVRLTKETRVYTAKLKILLSFLDTEVFKKPVKNCCNDLHLKANAQSLLYSVREKWRDSDFCTAMTSDWLDMAEGQGHFQRSQLSIFGITEHPEGDERPPHPLPLRELCPTVMPSSPPSRHRPNRSRKGEQSEKTSALNSSRRPPHC